MVVLEGGGARVNVDMGNVDGGVGVECTWDHINIKHKYMKLRNKGTRFMWKNPLK